jgi:nucleotide-binding universal stress UspA family protein
MESFKKILYPIALTEISLKVAPYVEDPPEPDFKRIASNFENQILQQAEQKLEKFIQQHLKGIQIEKATVVRGTHYRQIIDYAKSEGIDLIIMGSGTKGQRMIFGSVTGKVSRLSKVPVMLIKSS